MKFYAIRENHLFVKAYRGGNKAVMRDIILYVLTDRHAYLLKKQNPEKKKINRIGITATKTVGGAVVRSRVRRIIRAGYSEMLRENAVKSGYLVVIVARPSAAKAKSSEIAAELTYGMKKLGMIIFSGTGEKVEKAEKERPSEKAENHEKEKAEYHEKSEKSEKSEEKS